MKRLFVLGLVLAILAVGFTAFADPIQVGGTNFSSFAPIASIPGRGVEIPQHLDGIHVL